MIDKLLIEISAIRKKYALIGQKTGAYFNIFDIADISEKEVVICRILYELLNPNGSHYQGDVFLRIFVSEVLQLDISEADYKTARVFREYPISGNRRIDLFIEVGDYRIPIEVKLFADDQEKQCLDYYKYARNANIYYLTLDGVVPSEYSANGLTPIVGEQGEIAEYKEVTRLSFALDIITWLDRCLTLPEMVRIAPIREIVLQFKDVLIRLTGQMEGNAKMEAVNEILSSPDSIKSALDIEKALPEVKSKLMMNLLAELKRLFESSGKDVHGYDEDVIAEYYTSRNKLYPGFVIELAELTKDMSAILFVEIDHHLYFAFSFAEWNADEEWYDLIKTDEAKLRHPQKYSEFVTAITDAVGEGEKTEKIIFWDFLLDDNRQKYDFKHFSPSCIELSVNYTEQAKNMFNLLNGYSNAIIKKLK